MFRKYKVTSLHRCQEDTNWKSNEKWLENKGPGWPFLNFESFPFTGPRHVPGVGISVTVLCIVTKSYCHSSEICFHCCKYISKQKSAVALGSSSAELLFNSWGVWARFLLVMMSPRAARYCSALSSEAAYSDTVQITILMALLYVLGPCSWNQLYTVCMTHLGISCTLWLMLMVAWKQEKIFILSLFFYMCMV